MALFSQRKGLSLVSKAIQREAIDGDLLNYLWNALYIVIFKNYGETEYGFLTAGGVLVNKLCTCIWLNIFKKPLDTKPHFHQSYGEIRTYFYNAEWYGVYDLLEFVAKNVDYRFRDEFTELCNHYLEQESAAYRFVSNEITEITSEQEIQTIEEAIDESDKAIKEHLQTALSLMSDKKNPDYRNSIKESISAVESLCRKVSGNEKATLGDALKVIEGKCPIHPALKKAFSSIYGYTSDEDGIRHAMTETDKVLYSDAKFMLVECSAFVNYLRTKLSE